MTTVVSRVRRKVHREVLERIQPDASPDQVRREVVHVVRAMTPALGATGQLALIDACLDDIVGLGALEALVRDPSVTEVMYNGNGVVFVEQDGRLQRCSIDIDDEDVVRIMQRIVTPLGLRLDRTAPIVDARLADGARVHAVIPPLAVNGPCLTIRRFPETAFGFEAFAVDPTTAALCAHFIEQRWNILVVGGTSSGKTTVLNALGRMIPSTERIVTIEETAELALRHPHVVRLEARPANAEGVGAVPVRELVRTALRMRPDRIIVGEVRGGEALDMLQACNTGHDGSLSTLHANRAADAGARLATLVLLGAPGLPYHAVQEQITAAIDVVLHVGRGANGARCLLEVAEFAPDGAPGALRTLAREQRGLCRMVHEPSARPWRGRSR